MPRHEGHPTLALEEVYQLGRRTGVGMPVQCQVDQYVRIQ